MSEYSEYQFVCPALKIMAQRPDGFINTTDLIAELRALFKPTPPDTDILHNRSDDHFSQKVRNLVSHRDFNEVGYLAEYDKNLHGWHITEQGRQYADTCE